MLGGGVVDSDDEPDLNLQGIDFSFPSTVLFLQPTAINASILKKLVCTLVGNCGKDDFATINDHHSRKDAFPLLNDRNVCPSLMYLG